MKKDFLVGWFKMTKMLFHVKTEWGIHWSFCGILVILVVGLAQTIRLNPYIHVGLISREMPNGMFHMKQDITE